MSVPRTVAVVVPARDEEALLPACLASLRAALARLGAVHPDVRCRVFVVLDSCRDGSAEVVGQQPDVTALVVEAGTVGAARAVGVDAAAEWAATHGDPLESVAPSGNGTDADAGDYLNS